MPSDPNNCEACAVGKIRRAAGPSETTRTMKRTVESRPKPADLIAGHEPIKRRWGRLLHLDSVGPTARALDGSVGCIFQHDEDTDYPQAIGYKDHTAAETAGPTLALRLESTSLRALSLEPQTTPRRPS